MAKVKRWLVAVYSPGHRLMEDAGIHVPDYVVFGGGTLEWLTHYSYATEEEAKKQAERARGLLNQSDVIFDVDIPEELLVE